MKVSKMKLASILATVGLTSSVLVGCGSSNNDDDKDKKYSGGSGGSSTYIPPTSTSSDSSKSGVVSGSKGIGSAKGGVSS